MHRHVRHLRLACTQEDHARHGRILLEDALRTASFGDEGRLVVIRQLNVGRIPLRASATHWSQRIEESYRRLQPIPISIDSSGAERAAAVYFANAYEPWLRLAARAATGQPCAEWYWRAALPGWTSRLNATATLRLAFRALVAQGGLKLTLALGWRLRSLAPLLRALEVADLADMQREVTSGADDSLARAASASNLNARLSARRFDAQLDPAEAAIAASWPTRDLRLRWLAAACLARERVRGASAAFSFDVTRTAIEALVRHWSEPTPDQTSARMAEAPTAPAHDAAPHPTLQPPDPDKPAPDPISADHAVTRAGGLFFVVPLLIRAGLPEFITTLPIDQRAAYPWHVLRLILRHALGGTVAFGPPPPAEACPTPRRHGQIHSETAIASDPLAAALADLPEAAPNLGRWLIRANRPALRLAGLNLRQIVQRPALVSWSPTHIDFFFRADDADVRLRRAGLDVDPGWVPWLDRVIHYHYNREN